MLSGLYQHRGLIWRHAVNDLRHRYAGTGLGIVWNVLHPLAVIVVYSVVFSTIFHPPPMAGVAGGRFAYVLYLCAGFLPWLAFSECVTRGANAFTDNAAYLKKLPMPEQVFVAQSAASATLGLGISFSLLLVISLGLGLRPSWTWLLLPAPLLALQAMGFALGLLFGTLNAFFRDIGQLLSVAMQLVVWTAPIVYVADVLPATVQALLRWHPLVPPLEAIRDLFLQSRVPSALTWLLMFAWPAAFSLLATLLFSALRREIRDVV